MEMTANQTFKNTRQAFMARLTQAGEFYSDHQSLIRGFGTFAPAAILVFVWEHTLFVQIPSLLGAATFSAINALPANAQKKWKLAASIVLGLGLK